MHVHMCVSLCVTRWMVNAYLPKCAYTLFWGSVSDVVMEVLQISLSWLACEFEEIHFCVSNFLLFLMHFFIHYHNNF